MFINDITVDILVLTDFFPLNKLPMYILYDVIKTLLPLKSGYFLPHSRVKLYDVNKAQDENNQAKKQQLQSRTIPFAINAGVYNFNYLHKW